MSWVLMMRLLTTGDGEGLFGNRVEQAIKLGTVRTNMSTYRRMTDAEVKRRSRAGQGDQSRRGEWAPVGVEPPRNGLPVRPYRYRGSGPFDAGDP